MNRWVDIGVNLLDRRFSKDREQAITRAVQAGVTAMVVTGTSVSGSDQARRIAHQHPETLWSTAGVHPHDAKACDADTIPALRALAEDPKVVAIGECGLDFNRDFSPRPVQEQWFAAHIELACELQLPLFVHERDAAERLVGILDDFSTLPPLVVHCFTGEARTLQHYLDRDFFIGITGWICDERRGRHLLDLVSTIPAERLMLETDAPYLTPRDLRPKPRGGRNEPAFLPHIAATVARARRESLDQLATVTTGNARAFFGLDRSDG